MNNDFDFIKNKIDSENITAPDSLSPNEVKGMIYGNKPRVIKFYEKRSFKTAVTAAACLAVFALALFGVTRFDDRVVKPESFSSVIPTFKSYSQLEKKIKKNDGSSFLNGYGDFFKSADGYTAAEESVPEGGAVTGGLGSGETFSETNLQVEGVDEADIIKNDGRYIYYLDVNGIIRIYKPDGESAELVSSIEDYKYDYYGEEDFNYEEYYENYSTRVSIRDMFVRGDRLVLIGDGYDDSAQENTAQVFIYDISDITAPNLINSFSQSGYSLTSRVIGNELYLVSNYYTYVNRLKKPEQYAPKCGTAGELESLPAQDIGYIENSSENSFIVVSGIDVKSGESTADTKAVFGASAQIYCNENNLYAVSYNSFENENCDLIKLSLSPESIAVTAHTSFEGSVNDQFSMDEYNGVFRLAVTKYDYENSDNNINTIYTYNERLESLGSVDGFAEGEDIKAVRFMGDTAYVITFEQVDPLFVIDLSDPENPEILGEVEITGFSSQLTPVGDGRLLGIGFATEDNGEFVTTEGLKLVLFDVSDSAEPKVLDFIEFPDLTSEAQYNHKALAIDRKNGRYAVPFTAEREYYYDSEYDYWDYESANGALTFEIKNDKIEITNHKTGEYKNYYYNQTRCTFLGDYYYILTEDGIAGYEYN